MSATRLSNCNKTTTTYEKSIHGRKDSGELGVFEAAQYFSSSSASGADHQFNPTAVHDHNGAIFAQKMKQAWRIGRISLDIPTTNSVLPSAHNLAMEKNQIKEKIKQKQPSSPGGKLASFLNSLFNQSSSKNKKKLKHFPECVVAATDEDEDGVPGGGRRKRRSSISHFGGKIGNSYNRKSCVYSSSSISEFRTPPPVAPPARITADRRSSSNHREMAAVPSSKVGYAKSRVSDYNRWLDGREILEKSKKCGKNDDDDDDRNLSSVEIRKGIGKFDADDGDERDGAESDSSSDLFELKNYDLDYSCPRSRHDLPVYENTFG